MRAMGTEAAETISRMTARGHSAAEIARQIGCSPRTVTRVRNPKPVDPKPGQQPVDAAQVLEQVEASELRESTRIRQAADRLLASPVLGPAEFRTAVAAWLTDVATTTARIEDGRNGRAFQTLPSVLAILDVIERAS